MSLIAVEFPNYQILFGFALTGFFIGIGSELSKYLIHEYIIKHTERGINALKERIKQKW